MLGDSGTVEQEAAPTESVETPHPTLAFPRLSLRKYVTEWEELQLHSHVWTAPSIEIPYQSFIPSFIGQICRF